MRRSSHYGFTIVELLIVIVVIAILAAIVIVTYSGIQNRAQAAAISSGFQQVSKSMYLWAIEEGFTVWPYEPTLGGGTPLSQLIDENPSLQNYLQNVPHVQGIHTDEWFYDNDQIGEKLECDLHHEGVNIVIRYIDNDDVALMVDETIDDGDPNCGRVRYFSQRLSYALSYTDYVNE